MGPYFGPAFWGHLQADEKKSLLQDFVVPFSGPYFGPKNGATNRNKSAAKTDKKCANFWADSPPQGGTLKISKLRRCCGSAEQASI